MGTKPKHITATRDRGGVGLGSKRASFGPFFIAENDLINLFQGKAGELDRRLGEDQFLEFDTELGEIPLTFFAQPINRKAQRPLFRLRQVINPDAGHGGKTQKLSRFDPGFPVENQIVLANKDGSTKPERADRAHNFPHMSRRALADFALRKMEIIDFYIRKCKLG